LINNNFHFPKKIVSHVRTIAYMIMLINKLKLILIIFNLLVYSRFSYMQFWICKIHYTCKFWLNRCIKLNLILQVCAILSFHQMRLEYSTRIKEHRTSCSLPFHATQNVGLFTVRVHLQIRTTQCQSSLRALWIVVNYSINS